MNYFNKRKELTIMNSHYIELIYFKYFVYYIIIQSFHTELYIQVKEDMNIIGINLYI